MKCDVCGSELCDSNNSAMIGMRIEIEKSVLKHPQGQRVWSYFGKIKFNICYVCWLKSLGVKCMAISGQKYSPSIEEVSQIINERDENAKGNNPTD